ncbi:MAG: hypothetical protein JWQ99_3482 [Blastococcus sp.]|nr:hypothetical protein [Blastococcus sp.]
MDPPERRTAQRGMTAHWTFRSGNGNGNGAFHDDRHSVPGRTP